MFQEEAEKHWRYVKSVIEKHNKNLDSETIDIIGFHYIAAMVHGYKHGYNDTVTEIRTGCGCTIQDNKSNFLSNDEIIEFRGLDMSKSTYNEISNRINVYPDFIDIPNYIVMRLADGSTKKLTLI
jgi:hypothetical protein